MDPAAGLGWYAPIALNRPLDGWGDRPPISPLADAEIIARWMKADLAGATRWLGDWHPENYPTAAMRAKLQDLTEWEHRGFDSPEIRAAAETLFRKE